ncbi:GAF and ANTAR domain-containing protein [Microbacterium sp.]|uniref:GAF and ANTAR domain-containing protein n=1 Tax=Microbacterium sp. TaxID=51671 RepID=UPI002811637C|nr:GAF and ANTAR domain-containing protein [Microbacterium sp.]
MTTLDRDRRLLTTFTQLADTLVDDYDVVELMQRLVDTCAEQLEVAAAGLLLADGGGELELVASTSEVGTIVEALLLASQSPIDPTYDTAAAISVAEVAALGPEWEDFRRSALASGFTTLVTIPLRLRNQTIGALNLLQREDGVLREDDLIVARALADLATIGILHERALRETEALAEQLQHALNSRVVIEQAKGVVSHMNRVPVDEAFTLIRTYARSHGERLGDVARAIVERRLRLE